MQELRSLHLALPEEWGEFLSFFMPFQRPATFRLEVWLMFGYMFTNSFFFYSRAMLDGLGANVEVAKYTEKLVPSTRFVAVDGIAPAVGGSNNFVAPSASVIGKVALGDHSRLVFLLLLLPLLLFLHFLKGHFVLAPSNNLILCLFLESFHFLLPLKHIQCLVWCHSQR